MMKILLADAGGLENLLRPMLGGQGHSTAHSISAALEALAAEHFDALLIGLQLEDGSMLDLLRRVRADSQLHGVAVICIGNPAPARIPTALAECARFAARALGAMEFVDLSDPLARNESARRLKLLLSPLQSTPDASHLRDSDSIQP